LLENTQERGVHFGRENRLTAQQMVEMQSKREQGALIKTLMKEYGLSKASVYRYLNEKSIPTLTGG